MAKFILGYKDTCETVTVDGRNLTLYKTKDEAEYDSEEWCEVEAETEEQARGRYEEARAEWIRSEEFNLPPNTLDKDVITAALIQFEYFLERQLHGIDTREAKVILQRISEIASDKTHMYV